HYNIDLGNQYARQSESDYVTGILTVVSLMVLALGWAVGAGWLLGTSIAGPIQAMTVAMRRLAAREANVAVPAQGRGDEVGRMAEAVQVFKDAMIEADRMSANEREEHGRNEARAGRLGTVTQNF